MEHAFPNAGRYEIVREIGRGGMATVFLARHIDLDRPVALKALIGTRVHEPGWAERFLQEARLAGKLHHDRIVTVYDYFKADGTPFIAMEYLAHGSLRPLIGSRTPAQVVDVLDDLLEALAHAEQRGIVHRDIKPENLLITDDQRVKVADFGIAKALDAVTGAQPLTAPGASMGTPAYMAPEQAKGGPVTPAVDRYAVGVVAYELFTGVPPFSADTPMALMLKHLQEPVPPLRDRNPAIPPRLAAWVEQLLAKDPSERFASAAEAHTAFEDGADDLLAASSRRRTPGPTPPPAVPRDRDEIEGGRPPTEPARRAPTTTVGAFARRTLAAAKSTGTPRRRAAVAAAAAAAITLAVVLALALGGDRPKSATIVEPTETPAATETPTPTATEQPVIDAGTLTVDGPPLRVKLDRAGSAVRVRFDGREGQRVALFAPEIDLGDGKAAIDVYDPSDNRMHGERPELSDDWREFGYSFVLPSTGTYAIVIRPLDGATGSVELRLPTDTEVRARVDGPPVTVRVDTPGQNAIVRFRGREGQRVAVFAPEVDFGDGKAAVDLYDPGDNRMHGERPEFDGDTREFGYSFILPLTGTYAIVIRPTGGDTGSLQLRLPTDTEVRARVDGPPVTLRVDTPGQNAIVRFRGREGQRVAVFAPEVDFGDGKAAVDLYDPGDNRMHGERPEFDGDTREFGYSFILPLTGTYAIVIRPTGGDTGSLQLRLPTDTEVRARIDGPPVTVRIDTPGQNAIARFRGEIDETIAPLASDFALGANGAGSAEIDIYDPNDDKMNPGRVDVDAATRELVEPLDIATTGTHAIVIRPAGGQTGSFTLRLRQP